MGKIKKHVFVLLLVVTAIVGCDEKPKAVISNKPSFVLVKFEFLLMVNKGSYFKLFSILILLNIFNIYFWYRIIKV